MMKITAECNQCGAVELTTDEITLVVSPWEDGGWYMFDCRRCVQRVVRPATSSVVSVLTKARVMVSIVPAEVLERAKTQEQAPLSTDDLLDFLLWLRTWGDLGEALDDVKTTFADQKRRG